MERSINKWSEVFKTIAGAAFQEEYDQHFERLSIEELIDFEHYLRWYMVFAQDANKAIDNYLLEHPQQLEEYLLLKAEWKDYFPADD